MNRCFDRKVIFASLFCIFVLSCVIKINSYAQGKQHIKIIEAGWDDESLNAAELLQHLRQMDKSPYDGVMLQLQGKDDAGNNIQMTSTFSKVPWKLRWFQSSIDVLKAARSPQLTDNFIRLEANPGNVDWFDDAGWNVIINHWRIAAEVAKECGVKGIMFDPERYTINAPFDYNSQLQHEKYSFTQYQAKVRQRGKEVINAVAQVDPNLTIFDFFMFTDAGTMTAAQSSDPAVSLEANGAYNLSSAFINGWLDAAPPTMTFVDGCEPAYSYDSELDYLRTANFIRNTALNLIAPENRNKYKTQVQAAFAFYLDAYVNPPGSSWYIPPLSGSRVAALQTNLNYAAQATDQYIWTWGEKDNWNRSTDKTNTSKNWEDVLPGINQSLLSIAHPDHLMALAWQALQAQGRPVNLVQNGDFATQVVDQGIRAASKHDSTIQGIPIGWSPWQRDDSKGSFNQDPNVTHSGGKESGSAEIKNMLNGCLSQQYNAVPGELFLVRAWVRQQGDCDSWVRVDWLTPDSKWLDNQSRGIILTLKDNSDTGGWREIQGLVTVPTGAGKLELILSEANHSSKDIAWFDDVQLYKVPPINFGE